MLRWTPLVVSMLLLGSRTATAACTLGGARPTVALPTRVRGQDFSFIASSGCDTLRFTIRGTELSKTPKSGGPVGPGRHTYKVVLTEAEWNRAVAQSGTTLTWIVIGRTSTGETTRLTTTNALDLGNVRDMASADAKLVGRPADYAGFSLAGAGDVNGDGNDDLLVGAAQFAVDDPGFGAAYLVSGPVTGTVDLAHAQATFVGTELGVHAGECTAGVGDVDGDLHDDIMVGARLSDAGTGAAYLIYGPASGTIELSHADATFLGEGSSDEAGASLAGAGDMNDDGYGDLLIGASDVRSSSGGRGAAYLVHGPVTGTFDLSFADAILEHEDQYNAASSVASAGDVDGDGHDDLLIGSPYDNENGDSAGAAYFVRGPVSGRHDLALADAKLLGEAPWDLAARGVSAGDLDADGYDDLVIGAYGNDEGGEAAGAAYILLGPVTASRELSLADAKLVGRPGDSAGGDVAVVGDVDGDANDDLLVGAPNHPDGERTAGAAYLVLSPVAGTMALSHAEVKLIGEAFGDGAGHDVAAAHDVDADGRADFLIAAAGNDEGGAKAGAAYLFYGSGF